MTPINQSVFWFTQDPILNYYLPFKIPTICVPNLQTDGDFKYERTKTFT
ncbi:hypothetical protein PDY_32760 [Photobacterium damselae subsp. damselae]|nr:hypothetical protein PDY_32760 [Photobacterium damselae subsp. damselae]